MNGQEILIDANTLISAEELNNRIGEGDTSFIGRLKEGNFTVLYSGKPPRTNQGKIYYLCTTGTYESIPQFNYDDYGFDGFFIYKIEYENWSRPSTWCKFRCA